MPLPPLPPRKIIPRNGQLPNSGTKIEVFSTERMRKGERVKIVVPGIGFIFGIVSAVLGKQRKWKRITFDGNPIHTGKDYYEIKIDD